MMLRRCVCLSAHVHVHTSKLFQYDLQQPVIECTVIHLVVMGNSSIGAA